MQLGDRCFTLEDQESFARLTGDRNPMHLDPLFARRTQAGAPVVHGIHGVLWAMDLLAEAGIELQRDMHVRFEAFLYLGINVQAILRRQNDKTSVVLECEGRRITTISFQPPPRGSAGPESYSAAPEPVPEVPVDQDFLEASQASGAMILSGGLARYAAAFPNLAAAIGAPRVRAIAGLSTLVGMKVPGLHSIFSKCLINLDDSDGEPEFLRYGVLRAREPLRQLTVGFAGSGITGTIDAFVRHPPVPQPSLEELAGTTAGLDLAGQRALVVGGSRGLGELTAKIAALAGAEVTITYARGETEAARLCEQLAASGLRCRMRWLDVQQLDRADLTSGEFTHIYYFATPPIFSRTTDRYNPSQFSAFAAYYCDAFEELCRRAKGQDSLRVFWPSTTAIDERPKGMIEYVMAKSAGEALCNELERTCQQLEILTMRLPRLPTDQTSSVTPAQAHDPVKLIRSVLEELS